MDLKYCQKRVLCTTCGKNITNTISTSVIRKLSYTRKSTDLTSKHWYLAWVIYNDSRYNHLLCNRIRNFANDPRI